MPWQVAGYETDADKPFDQGSFGTVWHARRVRDGLRVALKLVRRAHGADAAERIDAERRGAMLQKAFHEAHGMVPAVFDVGHDADGDLYIAMELIEGGSLAEAIAAGPLPPEVAIGHALAICGFLEKAHGFATTIEGDRYDRLVHADLKPGHIVARHGVDSVAGDLVVLDFGIAKALHKATPLTTNNWGTSAYMSPERLIDGRVDEQVDYWSLGVILFEMLAGHRPYRALQAPSLKAQLERAIRGNEPREPLPQSVPAGLVAVVNRLLAYQPERRYPSAALLRADLQACLEGRRPSALADWDTPATMRVDEATERRVTPMVPPPLPALPGAAGAVPPTEPRGLGEADGRGWVPPPIPVRTEAAGDERPGAAPAAAGRADGPAPRPRRFRRLVSALVVLVVLYLAMLEAVAWLQAERLRDVVPTIDGPSLTAAEASYARVAQNGTLDLGLRLRVNGLLREHLLGLAGRVVEDYRSEQPSLSLSDWKQAQQALQWALRLSPGDRRLEARLALCEAHILRIAPRPGRSAATQATYRRAIDRFRAAARLDPESFDAYLGISRIAVYGLVPADVELASEAMAAAEQRGYVQGRRERALLGDGHMRRGDTLRREARSLSGAERARALEGARDSFTACVEAFEPILGFANAARNIETCKAQLDDVEEALLAAAGSAEPE
ncbi:hypothetical protein TBR22_A14060 [Luteitalea sp. TBR-22]|uniref:serine/threonine-protein kinase n=1 Tax=Luteitalea sp. TBR-22 TaxID=2802971 RepID=UPI001AFC89C3|nr:serine/threonine-protein kinase [Luteitalea sp. TBR-22]BCS32196.1 hypothetical protein TBR22_A14060 [Luteitalea sp. TBR-22]